MLILDYGNSLVYSSIPVLGSCPGLIYLETTCTRGHFLFRCSLSSNDGKRRFHASNTPFSFPWMVFHSFLVIIPIVWVNKRDYLPIFLFSGQAKCNWSVPPIIILLEPSKKFSWSWVSGPIEFGQSHLGNTSNISKINQDKFHTQFVSMDHID